VKVLVNATSARLGGGVTVLKHLLPALLAEDGGEHRYTVVARSELRESLDPHSDRASFLAAPAGAGAARRLVFEQLALPLRWADVLIAAGGVASFASSAPEVLLIQNAAPFDADVRARAPRWRRARLELLRTLVAASARRAARVVFLSESARATIAPQLGVLPERCACVPLGRDPAFSPAAGAERPPIDGDYVLCVSQHYHYKNLPELVIGFARAALPAEVRLAIAGEEHEPEVAAEVRRVAVRCGVAERVLLLGHVDQRRLPALYAGARAFVFPSTCESFPNILVEALACGAPTAASRLGPMPEIAGDAALYFDPFDPDEIGAALSTLHADGELRASLRAKGPERVARYTWPATARAMLALLREAAR